jgi:hypothetical protein
LMTVFLPFVYLNDDLSRTPMSAVKAPSRPDGCSTSWPKIRNPPYSQMEGRHELLNPRAARTLDTYSTVMPSVSRAAAEEMNQVLGA